MRYFDSDFTAYALLGVFLILWLVCYDIASVITEDESSPIFYNLEETSADFWEDGSLSDISNKEKLILTWEESVGTTKGKFTIPQFKEYKSMFEFEDKSYYVNVKENDWLLFRNLNPLTSNRGLMLSVIDRELHLKDITLNIIENTLHSSYVNHENLGSTTNGWVLHKHVDNESFYLNKTLDKDLMVEVFVNNKENMGVVINEEALIELANKLSEVIIIEESTGTYNGFINITGLNRIALDNKISFDLSKLKISGWLSGDNYHSFEAYSDNGLKLHVTEYLCRFDEFLSRESIPYTCSYIVEEDITYVLMYVDSELTGVVYCNDNATYFVSIADRVNTLSDEKVLDYVTKLFLHK